jgi:hypothetical protein
MTFPVIHGISSAPMEFQVEVSARIIPQDVAQVIPPEGERVAAGVVLADVSRYTYLAAHVRQASGMADGWQRVDRVSYAKYAPVVTRRPSAATDRCSYVCQFRFRISAVRSVIFWVLGADKTDIPGA